MPQDGGAGVLSDDIKIDILAYIMQVSGIPAGEGELKLDPKELEGIKIARKTVADGVYSGEQAVRGKAAFTKEGCPSCHQIDLSGNRAPALKGNEFLTHWENGAVNSLFAKIRDTMPPNGPQDVTPETKIDIVSYLLESNGFPAGRAELKPDSGLLENVDIIRRGGGAGVPNFSLVQAVGCLTPGPKSSWLLKRSSEPVVTRDEEPTPQLITAAQAKPLGAQDLLLVSAAGFQPASQAGKKVEVRGLLYRDGGETRINLTSLQAVGQTCN
jgi:mono/diheme cytochrome c family protein